MFCAYCGRELPEQALYCDGCGMSVKRTAGEGGMPEGAAADWLERRQLNTWRIRMDGSEDFRRTEDEGMPAEKRRGWRIPLFIAVIILALVLGVVAAYRIQARQKEETAQLERQMSEAVIQPDEPVEYGTIMSGKELLAMMTDDRHLPEDAEVFLYLREEKISADGTYSFDEVGSIPAEVNVSCKRETGVIWKRWEDIINKEKVTISVVDTAYPIFSGVEDKEILVGEDVDLLSGITAVDPVDGELDIVTEGEADVSTPGEYVIKLLTTDKNGNPAEAHITVRVKEREPSGGSSGGAGVAQSSGDGSGESQSSGSDSKAGRQNIAREEARNVVARIITEGMSDYDKAFAICDYLYSSVELQTDQSTEAYRTNYGSEAYAALILKKAACSGYCHAVTLLCEAAGLQSQHVNEGQWTHQWNRVLVDGQWIVVDAQAGIFGGTVHPLEM